MPDDCLFSTCNTLFYSLVCNAWFTYSGTTKSITKGRNHEQNYHRIFHDAVCGWCYVLSPRLRKWANHPDVEIIQRCFVLQRNDEEMIQRFGSLQIAKLEILNHWRACQAKADDPSSINIEGMAAQDFPYPSGYAAAKAAKAAELMKDTHAHWNVFDRIQQRHLKWNQNIALEQVLADAAVEEGLDREVFLELMNGERVTNAIEADLIRARAYNIMSIPTLVINGQKVVSSTLSQQELDSLIASEIQYSNERVS